MFLRSLHRTKYNLFQRSPGLDSLPNHTLNEEQAEEPTQRSSQQFWRTWLRPGYSAGDHAGPRPQSWMWRLKAWDPSK